MYFPRAEFRDVHFLNKYYSNYKKMMDRCVNMWLTLNRSWVVWNQSVLGSFKEKDTKIKK